MCILGIPAALIQDVLLSGEYWRDKSKNVLRHLRSQKDFAGKKS
jgi:hypothetical protein